jgi:DNA-binding transcriptional LysR family regulator
MSTCHFRTVRSALLHNEAVEIRRLQLLDAFARLGSMRAVAEEQYVTTSTVSQGLAVLAREAGAVLIEPDGRGVRLTPAGRRLADHAVTILAEVEAARADLDAGAEPVGTVRVAGFATAMGRSLLPVFSELVAHHPDVRLLIHEHEPAEAFALLAGDDVDLALVYDYNLAPTSWDASLQRTSLWTAAWGLGVPSGTDAGEGGDAAAVFARFRDAAWIVNSRNTADEHVVRTLASLAGFEPQIAHRMDSLDLVEELIVGGLGVGLLPVDRTTAPGVSVLALDAPGVLLRCYAVTRRGRGEWAPLALVMRLLAR